MRDFTSPSRASVQPFYALNHSRQTLEFARAKAAHYGQLKVTQMGVWEACEKLNQLQDDSDPDTALSQLEHLLQTAEAIRHDGWPDWFVLTGLVHDLGKMLCLYGEPQWAVTGDTFPLGCPFSEKIVYSELFRQNPDLTQPELQSAGGVYERGCGLANVVMSWGHDEYMYQVCRDYLPEPALYMIRYHSFYAAHQEGEYRYLMNDHDLEMLEWVVRFQPYDLYSKSDDAPDPIALKAYYAELISKYFPTRIAF